MFAVTNIDDLVVLAVFFGRAGRRGTAIARVCIGQYVGFAAIVVASVFGALGANLLPHNLIPYLGLLPLLLGVRAAWQLWRQRQTGTGDDQPPPPTQAAIAHVAAVTFANGGDNIGVYVPVFATAGTAAMTVYITVFLAGVALWCAAGWYFASRPAVAEILTRWGHLILPVVLIGLGIAILAEGGVFGR
ncbi:cadmium resistance transporter [Mycobacteroides abscessus]|uniref:Permease, cadmium resistance protein n=4 Tax=Mycobacteroides abscessus TaxID=36809 RepID=A0A0U0ZJ00_9MYCO|nr:cadmium resistance transporter [Mycobacteroides abscessus]MBL3761005.1 cadmium resistance transporter [Mycobacteroides abscessus subsp. massiliense]MDB2214338.1 cadmium resistance transporter [Mycobacteroides abscessus subsp. massiliense]MDM2103897.1 cadmium resistance transporter [Mycobacteroides abscessus]MDM2135847.1 cadmium resistance transporter [Mycobacteroides abscessus]MDM2141409.1 cadmium resistance transporter [Mycobacteroides abscessus]